MVWISEARIVFEYYGPYGSYEIHRTSFYSSSLHNPSVVWEAYAPDGTLLEWHYGHYLDSLGVMSEVVQQELQIDASLVAINMHTCSWE